MSIGYNRGAMNRRVSTRSVIGTAAGLLGLGLAVLVAVSVFAFSRSRNFLPKAVFLGETAVGGLTVDQAITRTMTALSQPIILRYESQVLPVDPRQLDFAVNDAVARLALEALVKRQQGFARYPEWLKSQVSSEPITPTRISIPFNYSERKLETLVLALSEQVNRSPSQPAAAADGLSLVPGQTGLQINIPETTATLLHALGSEADRVVDLPVDIAPVDAQRLKALADMVTSQVNPFVRAAAGNAAGIYIKDLRSGEEVTLNGDVAFAAPGWARLAVAVDAARAAPPDGPQKAALAEMLAKGSPEATASALGALGGGDAAAGAARVNVTMRKLGLLSTFVIPEGRVPDPLSVVTPGSGRSDILGVDPGRGSQATPAEIGLLLEMLDQCANGRGPLALALDGQPDRARCEQLMAMIAAYPGDALIGTGTNGSPAVQRASWDAHNHGAAALVRSNSGSYVIAVMLYGRGNLDWAETGRVIANVSRAAYGYFNGGKAPEARTSPALPPLP